MHAFKVDYCTIVNNIFALISVKRGKIFEALTINALL